MTGILCSLPMIGAPTAAASTLAASLNRTSVSGSASTASVTTNTVTVTGSGGVGGYTYAWSYVSGNRAITASSASSATTSFQRSSCTAGTSYGATWHCNVTDAAGNTVFSANVTVTITRTGTTSGGGGGGTGGGGTFFGISNATVTVSNPAPTTATYTIRSDGTITGPSPSQTWNSSSTAGSGYEVKATLTSGALSSGTTGSWLALSSNRAWATTSPPNGLATFTLQIRNTGSTTVLDSATITLSAEPGS